MHNNKNEAIVSKNPININVNLVAISSILCNPYNNDIVNNK